LALIQSICLCQVTLIESLLLPENKDKLIAVLTYHVIPGKVMAADVVKVSEAPSLQGQMIAVNVDGSVCV